MNGAARALDGLARSDVEVVVRRIGGRITDIRPTRRGIGSRLFSPDEEARLAATFGPAWDDYRTTVKIPWI